MKITNIVSFLMNNDMDTMIKKITFQGKKLCYMEKGTGRSLILVHGYLEKAQIWMPFFNTIAQHVHVIAIDLPGYGESEVIEKCTINTYADAIRAVLDNAGIEKSFIVGHSMGGYASLAFAEKYPERLSALCLFHSTPFTDSETKVAQRLETIELIRRGSLQNIIQKHVPMIFSEENEKKFSQIIETMIESMTSASKQGTMESLNAMRLRNDYSGMFSRLTIPVLYIFGTHDRFISKEVFKKISFPPRTVINILEFSGHAGFIEEKEKTLQIFINFINQSIPKE